ncbi:MAG: FHA domain-containing protein [Myxococcales bacterium]|nr:FHA domain-containing protein [Myxococcales bacterium]
MSADTRLPATLRIGHDNVDCGFLRFIGDSAFIVAEIDPPIGATATLELVVNDKPLALEGVVSGSTGHSPVTIELEVGEMSDQARGQLRSLVRRTSGQYNLPTPRTRGGAEPAPPPRARARYAVRDVNSPTIAVCLGRRLLALHQVDQDVINIGRAEECELRINNVSVSRKHCRIERVDRDYWLEDEGASNRTLLNGKPAFRERLQEGDEISVGKYLVLFAPTKKQLPSHDLGAEIQSGEVQTVREDTNSGAVKASPLTDERTFALDPADYKKVLSELQSERRAHLKVLRERGESSDAILLAEKRIVLGRGKNADVVLQGWWRVRKEHAAITRLGAGAQERHTLEVLGRGKPVLIGGKRVRHRATLVNEDVIQIGANRFRFYASVTRSK